MRAFLLLVLCSVFCVLCFTSSPTAHDRVTTKVTWSREIAPIVQARCVSCHAPGGRAPMSLATYAEARPWAKAIKEEVLARRMPKWPVVRGYGDFTNDPSLSAFEVAVMAAWADGGAPLGTPSTISSQTPSSDRGRPRARRVERPCSANTLPPGRLVGLQPTLKKGESLRLTLVEPGREEPLLWIRNYDPQFAETYWLRNPMPITRGSRFRGEALDGCSLAILLEAGTGK